MSEVGCQILGGRGSGRTLAMVMALPADGSAVIVHTSDMRRYLHTMIRDLRGIDVAKATIVRVATNQTEVCAQLAGVRLPIFADHAFWEFCWSGETRMAFLTYMRFAARKLGHEAARSGKPFTACPFPTYFDWSTGVEPWLDGWFAGFFDAAWQASPVCQAARKGSRPRWSALEELAICAASRERVTIACAAAALGRSFEATRTKSYRLCAPLHKRHHPR